MTFQTPSKRFSGPDCAKCLREAYPQFSLLQDIEQIRHRPALYQGGRQPHNVWWLGLLVQRRQENATFALFRRGDFDLGIGGQTAVEGGERRLYFAAQVLHKHLRLTRLLESCVIFVAPEVKVFSQVLVGIAEAVG